MGFEVGGKSPRDPDQFRNWLAFFLISSFVGTLPLLIYRSIPNDSKEIIVYMIGQLSGMATTALGFYFTNKHGAEALDAKRAETTKSAFEAMAETAKLASPSVQTGSGGDAPAAAQVVADAAQDKADVIAVGKEEK